MQNILESIFFYQAKTAMGKTKMTTKFPHTNTKIEPQQNLSDLETSKNVL